MERKTIRWIWMIFSAILVLAACQTKANYENISADDAKKLIDDNKVEIIDVRTEEEYKEGHIPGAKLIPVDELENHIEELDKEQAYLMVCRSGNRSSHASQQLIDHGFQHVYNLADGMIGWTYEVE